MDNLEALLSFINRKNNNTNKCYTYSKEDILKIKDCESCILSKFTNKVNKNKNITSYNFLNKIVIDI